MTPVTGECRPLANGFEARIRIADDGARKGFFLTAIAKSDEPAAKERTRAMAEMAVRLRRAGHGARVVDLLTLAAKARAGRPWEAVLSAVDIVCGGQVTAAGPAPTTVAKLGEDWRDGTLHRRHPDHVKAKKPSSIRRDGSIASVYIDPVVGTLAIVDVTLEDCERVMADIPEGKATATRRQVAQYLRRLLQMAVYPLRLRADNPIPKGWLPRVTNAKAKECLYPDEDRALLACTSTPLLRRLVCGVLAREGFRDGEIESLEWASVDLERGRIALDENKTGDPRDWDMDPGVCRALASWKERYQPDAKPDDLVFAEHGVTINLGHLAEQLRRDLRRAGVTREKLFEKSASRQPIRAHDLRATFITTALATGKTETWVMDRTGHTTSAMLSRYRRKARGWKLGPLDALDAAIPELRSAPQERPTPPASGAISGRLASPIAHELLGALQATGTGRPFESAASTVPPLRPEHEDLPASPMVGHDASTAAERAPHEHGALHGALDVEAALAFALTEAAKAGRFDVVATLAAELAARRIGRPLVEGGPPVAKADAPSTGAKVVTLHSRNRLR